MALSSQQPSSLSSNYYSDSSWMNFAPSRTSRKHTLMCLVSIMEHGVSEIHPDVACVDNPFLFSAKELVYWGRHILLVCLFLFQQMTLGTNFLPHFYE